MVLPPMVYKSDDRETIAHFRTVAKATDLPIMVYNNPPAYNVDITPEMFAELADEPKFACIKESSDNLRRITDIINLTGTATSSSPASMTSFSRACCSVRSAGCAGWSTRSRARTGCSGTWRPPGSGTEALRRLPLVHAAAAPGHAREAGAVHQAGVGRVRLRHRAVPAAAAAARRRRARGGAGGHPGGDRDAAGDKMLARGDGSCNAFRSSTRTPAASRRASSSRAGRTSAAARWRSGRGFANEFDRSARAS